MMLSCTPQRGPKEPVTNEPNTTLNPPSKFIRKQVASLDRQVIAREFKTIELVLRTADPDFSGNSPAWSTIAKQLEQTDRGIYSRFVSGEYVYVENNRNIWVYPKDALTVGGPVLTPEGVRIVRPDELQRLLQ